MKEQTIAFLKKHMVFLITMVLLAILAIYIILQKPQGNPIPSLEKTFFLFSLGLQASVFIYCIAIYLLNRWKTTGKSNQSTLIWGIAFAVYGVVFVAVMFQALGYPWANMNLPLYFFIFRQAMIIWVALMYYGMASIILQSKIAKLLPTILIIVFSYVWFYVGLFIMADVEYTMYIFLFCIWTPICFVIAYMFYLYGQAYDILSPKICAGGFILLGITYLAWAPWHFGPVVYIYFIWFSVFNISLVVIFIGFLLLPYEIEKKVKKADLS